MVTTRCGMCFRHLAYHAETVNRIHYFGTRLIALRHEFIRQFSITFDIARFTPNLHSSSLRIIDQKQMGLGIFCEVALRDVLPIAREIDEADSFVVKHP